LLNNLLHPPASVTKLELIFENIERATSCKVRYPLLVLRGDSRPETLQIDSKRFFDERPGLKTFSLVFKGEIHVYERGLGRIRDVASVARDGYPLGYAFTAEERAWDPVSLSLQSDG